MNIVTSYMKNIGKSVAFAAIAEVKEKSPAIASFTESNQELYKETFHAIRDYKGTIDKTKQIIQNSSVYKAGDMAFNNALADIKSGNLYNQEREDSLDSFGDMGDFGGDDGFSAAEQANPANPDAATISLSDKMVISAVQDSSKKNAYAVSNAVASSAQYIANTNKSIANMQYVQNTKMMGMMESGFRGVSNGIDALHRFNATVMTTHAENSKVFFEQTTRLNQERNAILKEMLEMQRNQYQKVVAEEKERKFNRFGDIVNANGTPDLKAYMKAIGGNFKNAVDEQSGGMMGMLSGDNLKMLAQNPLGFIPQLLISSMMGPKLNVAIKKLDKTLTGAFATAMARLNKNASDTEASPLTQFFGKVFGLKNSVKSSIDTSNFDKGTIPFDGETKKAIVEVLPGYLRRIESALTGAPERLYDLKSGRWTDSHAVKKNFERTKNGYVKGAFSDVNTEIQQMLQAIHFENRKDKEDFIKGIESAQKQIYADFGYYNPHDKDSFKAYKYGFKNKNDQKLFDKMMVNLKHGTMMNMANEVANAREMQNQYMEELEKKGTSVFNNLFNNSGFGSLVDMDEKTGKVKSKLGNLGDAINPLKVEDKFKKNIFDYLRSMDNKLYDIRTMSGNGGGYGGRRGGKRARNGVDYTEFSGKDWDALDKSRNGKPLIKSERELRDERRANADRSYATNSKRERARLAKSGIHVETYDAYDDDSASRARGSVQGYANVKHALSNRRDLRENTSWLNEFFQDNAKKSRDRLAEKYPNKSNKKESLSTRLMQAATLSDKYDVIRESLDHLTSAPTTMLAGVIEKADANIYDFFYGKDTNDKDEHGNPIKGFFNKMVFDMQKTFSKVNTWIDDTLIKPFNKKFGGSTLWGSTKNAIKKTTGFDVDDTVQRAKDFFVGDNGILRSTIDSIKTSYKEAYEEVKRDMKKSYKDANELYNNRLLGRETDEQRISRVRATTGLNDISDASAFRYAVANSASTKQAIAKKKKYAAEKNKILEQLRTEKDPKKLKYLTKKLNLVNSSIKSLVTNKVEAYNSRNNRIKGINSQIAGYSNDDSEILSAREAKAAQLSKLKSTLGLDANLDLGSIDTSSGDYAYLNDSQVKGTFNQAKALQTQIAGMKTELEKLKEERDSLQREQKKAWSTTGTSKDSLMKNSSFLMSYANSHRREFDGDTKAYNEALQDLSNILGISDEKTSTKSIMPESTKTLESRYVSAIGKLANAADPVKVLSVKINKIQNNGGVASKLVSQMNKIVASKGALFGRYRSEFSEALGKMGVSEGQIESTVNKLFDSNTPEQLKKISGSVTAFISAVKQANPSLDGIVSAYEGRDTAVGNYAVQGAYSGFSNAANANYASDAFSAWASESKPIKRESLGFKSQSEIAKETKQYKQQTGLFASGARMITKAGLSVLSPGEAVIPADMNPFNPNAGTADRRVQSANEKRIKNNFLSSIKGMNSDDIGEYANGTTNVGGDGALATGIQNFKDGIGSFLGDATGVSSMKSKVNEANETVRKYLPGAIGGSLVGGTAGLLIGGPLVGAVLGSAVSIAKNSSTLQETLFGKEIVDQNGEKQGRDNSGLISGDMQKSISKYLPDAKAYGITGSILGLLTPFGPLGGLMLGSGIAFAKNNDKVKNALFGEKDGLFNGDTQRTVKKAFPNIAAATLGTLFLGPFGLMGNAALGAGIGLVSSTDEFKDFMLGKPDKDGKRTGGLAGEIRNTVVNPLAKMASGVQSRFFNFMQKDMLDPIKLSIAPIGKQISLAIKDTFTGVGKVVSYALKSSLGIPLVKRVGEALKYAMDPFGINKWLLKNGTEYAGKVISAPSKAIGWLGDRARMHQIKKSNADYMTADERLEFMAKHGKDYKLKGYDEMLSNSSKEDLERVKDIMGSLKEGRGFLDDRYNEATKNLGESVSNKFDVHTSKKIIKAAQNGEMDLAMSLIQNSDLSTVEKEKLSKEVNKHADRFREISYRKNTYTKNEDAAYKELQERFGIKGINKNNISKFRSVLDTEITSRHPKSDKEKESQSTEITSTLDANTNKLIDALAMINTTLTTMRDGATGLDADQQEALKATRELGDSAASAYAAKNNLSAARKNSLVSKYYGEGFKLDDKHKYLFQDNDKRFKQVHGLAKAGYNFSNLNDALGYDQDSFDRFEKLAKVGYKLEKPADYKKIAEMSASGFENVLEMSKAGMKITDLNYAVNLDAKKRDSMIELYQNGYDNVSPKELEKLIGKKSQLLYGPQADKAKAAARASKNVDAGVKADGVYQVNTSHIGPEDANLGFFKRQLSKAKGLGSDIMSQARAMAGAYGPGLQMIPIMAGAGIAGMMQGSHQQDDSNKQQVTVNTDYGVETYTRSTDGSLDLAKNKQNQDIADKINQRDQTQKGILESLKAMAGDAKAKGKGKLEKAKDSKGGLLGLLTGLAGMLKLPLTMLKSLGSLINLPMKMLGMGGVLPGLASSVGSFALSKAKGLFNWGANKVGGLASAGWNKLASTKLGQKIGNSKIGRLFSKAKGMIGGGGGAGADADGNPVDNPQDPADAINVQRDTLSSYLQKIIDLLSNTSGAAGAGPMKSLSDSLRGRALGGPEATAGAPAGKKPGVLGRIGGFFSKHAGKIALGLGAAGALAGGGSQSTSSFTDDAITTMQVGEDVASTGIGSTILTKTKDALRNIGNKISKFIPKGAGEAVQRFFGAVYDKVSNPKSIEKIAKRAGIKLGMDAVEASAGAGTLGIGALAIGAGEAVMWFMKGWNSTNDNFSLQNNAEPSIGMKFISGISEAVIGMTPIGYLIDTKDVIDLATQYIGPSVGFNKSDTNRINSNASNGGSDDNSSNSNNSDNSKGFLSSAWDTVKGVASKAADVVGNAYEGAKSMVKSGANWVGDKVSGFANWAKSKFGGGKYGRGKYGRGKWGRGAMGDIKASIADIPMDSVPDYNRINDDDDLLVARAKAANIRKLYGKAAPTPAAPTSVSDITQSSTPAAPTPAIQTPSAPAPQQNTGYIPPYNQINDDDDLLVRQAKLAAQAKARQNAAPTAAVAVQNNAPVVQSAAQIPSYNQINDDDDLLVRRAKTVAQAKVGQTTPIYSNRTQTSQSSTSVASTPASNTTSYQTTLYGPTQNGVNDDNKIDYLHDSIQTIQAKRRAQILARAAKVRQMRHGKGKWGRGTIDDIRASIADIPMDSVPDYNQIKDDDDILVAKAKAANIRKLYGKQTVTPAAPAATVAASTPTPTTDTAAPVATPVAQNTDVAIPAYNQINDDDDLLVRQAKLAAQAKARQNAAPTAAVATTTAQAVQSMAQIPDYNQIKDEDDLTVRQAKLVAQAKAKQGLPQSAPMTALVGGIPYLFSDKSSSSAKTTTSTISTSAPAVQTSSTDNRIDFKHDSLQTYQAKRRAQLLARARASRVKQTRDGQGKWGKGAVASDATDIFHSQLDPVNSMEFNAPGDSQYQNMADSGCGPASAANMASALGVPMDTKAAASYALEKGYKEKDGGTRPEFFRDYLGKSGIQTSDLNNQNDIKSQLSSGHPVLLMGTDSHNSPMSDAMGKSGTPFGPNPHYVVATGMDKDNITIQDPESNTPNQKYKTSKVLNNSSLAMAAGRGKFGNKFGRGKAKSIFGRGSKTKTKYGRGACEEDPPFGSIAGSIAGKCGSSHPEFFWAQMMLETGGPEVYKANNDKYVGFDDHNYGGFTWYEGMGEQYRGAPRPADEGGYYAKFSSDEEYAQMAYDKVYKSYAGELAQCNTAEDFAHVLKEHGYFRSDEGAYASNMASILNGQYKNSLSKIHAGPASSSGGNNKSGGKDYSGLFGQIAQITDTLAGAFTTGAAPTSTAPASTKQSANQQATAAIADLMAKVKAGQISIEDFIQQADDNPNINRDQIWKALADGGYGDADTKAAFDKYYKAMDDASKDKSFQTLGDNLKAGTLSVADFVQQADAMPNVPRNSIKHVLMQDNLWNDDNKAIYDDYYDKKDGAKSKDDNSNNTATDDSSSGQGKFGRGKFGRSKFGRGMSALSKTTPIKFGRSKFGRGKFGRGTDDQSATDTTAATTTTDSNATTTTTPATTTTDPKADPNKAKTTAPKTANNGIFGAALTAANTLSSKMKKYMGPLSKAIGSTATKIFGGNISKIFGNTNPFDSIFSSGQQANANTNNTNKTSPNGTFNSTSTDEGIRAASAWAQSVIGQSLYGDNGCTAFVRDYLLKANNPLGQLMQDGSQGNLMWVPTLAAWARSNGTWKDASQGGAEGDVAVTLNEGHVIIADGQGGAWGHGGDHTIKHYSSISGAFGQPDGYISTGSGTATVSNGDATRSKEEMIADAGSSNGGGKWGRGKWGRGTNFGPRYGKGSKFGRSKMDDIMQSVAYAPRDKISSYNLIDPNTDDLFVAQAKADNIKKLFPPKDIAKQVQKQIINPLPATSSATSTPAPQATPVAQTTTTTTAQQQPAQPVVNVPDNGEKLDSIIQLLTGIGGQLAVIANALTNGDGKVSPAQARTAVRQAMANGGGFSDMFGGQDTSSIFQAMTAVATK